VTGLVEIESCRDDTRYLSIVPLFIRRAIEEVVGFDVAVYEARRVRSREPGQCVLGDRDHFSWRQDLALVLLVQGLALELLHHQVRSTALGPAKVVNPDDVLLLELDARARLDLEPLLEIATPAQVGAKDFHDVARAESAVGHLPDLAHAALSDGAVELVRALTEIAGEVRDGLGHAPEEVIRSSRTRWTRARNFLR